MAKVKTCIAKVGRPDMANGMVQCGMPVFYAVAGEIVNGEPARYSGWCHVYDEDYDHGGVPRSWI